MWKSLASCADNARLISRRLDAPLPLLARLVLLIHLAGCSSCRRYSWQVRFLHQALARYDRELELIQSEPLPVERRAQIKQLLRTLSEAEGGGQQSLP